MILLIVKSITLPSALYGCFPVIAYTSPPLLGLLWATTMYSIHEVVSHLGNTHLVLEGALVGMHRTLPAEHPIYALLHPHLEGTAYINMGAQDVRTTLLVISVGLTWVGVIRNNCTSGFFES